MIAHDCAFYARPRLYDDTRLLLGPLEARPFLRTPPSSPSNMLEMQRKLRLGSFDPRCWPRYQFIKRPIGDPIWL